MGDNSTNVIPFNFGKQQVRTLLINDQPWFVAADVSSALLYAEAKDMTRNLDDDEKGRQIVPTPGGAQEMLVINESGLYSAILRSRKAEAKRFKKWVTSEVLPAIRKHGRYEDHQAKMPTLMDELIGMSELSVIKGLIRDKGKAVPADRQKSFALTMHNRLHTRFNVPRTELIPAGQFEAACNFIAAYNVLEGEFIAKEPPQLQLPLNIHYPIEALAALREGMLTIRNDKQAWLDVKLEDLRDSRDNSTPLESLLWDLEKAGFDIRGAWWELRTYRNKLREISSFVIGMGRVMEEPQRYAVDAPKGRAAA
ncbi:MULTISPECIES: Bro-N domain-containing protein [Pseudomonas]|uniref:BRO-N domain-containing protein n=1 Tax=Pseudomonas guariconensis TaxID=1288410 RepID=UPI002097C134|nr:MULTISPECIES: Bro-N domain-containing protein [Pseudomonas]MCO7595073.1 Bro-N domain-containing protein [Pseudomonas guariconensis]MCU7221047.1 Bro-N domain-containing protein [Pseudomonas brassicacearum]